MILEIAEKPKVQQQITGPYGMVVPAPARPPEAGPDPLELARSLMPQFPAAEHGFAGAALMEYVMNGRLPERMGNRSPWAAPQGCYRCRGDDDWISIAVANDQEWRALCSAMGKPELARDERFSSAEMRWSNQDELDQIISEKLKIARDPRR